MNRSPYILLGCIALLFAMTSCITGSTLRTARVLEKGQIEISGGYAQNLLSNPTQVVIGAVGLTDYLELEGRWEDEFFAATPRLQLLWSETACVDALAFFELGYSKVGRLQ